MPYPPIRSQVQPLESRRLLSLTPVGPAVTVPRFDPRESLNGATFVDVAVAGDGSFVVASNVMYGSSAAEYIDPRVEVCRYSAEGELIYGPVVVRETHIVFQELSVSTDADGDAVVVYWGRESEQATEWHAYFNLISKDGVVHPPVEADDLVPSALAVSMDDAGGFFLCGWAPSHGMQGAEVTVQAFDATGSPRAPAFIALDAGPAKSYFEIQSLPDGSGAVFAYVQGTTPTLTYGRVSTMARVGKARYVAGINPDRHTGTPSVALHPDGSFVVAYRREGEDPPREVTPQAPYALRCDAAGNPLGPEIELGAGLPGGPGLEKLIRGGSVDALPDGGFIATFAQTSGEFGNAVFARRFDANGVPEPAVPVSVEENGSLIVPKKPVIRAASDGRLVVAWDPAGTPSARFRRLRADVAFVDDNGELYVTGTEDGDHVIVERVRENLFVNVNGVVQRFNAADVQFLSISGLGGDDDVVNATALPATIHGGDGADTIWGGVGPDRIRGFGGDDWLFGGDGNDQVLGDAGSDHVSGGDDNDNLQGDVGEDMLLGGSGNDVLLGHRGSDRLYGEAGNDVLLGGDADDYLEAGAGHDELYGQAGRDALFGLAGNDRLFADDGAADTVRGGLGDDSGRVDDFDDVLAVEAMS